MALHCINCDAVYADKWRTDNTARMQTPVCPHCGYAWYEDTEDGICEPRKAHYMHQCGTPPPTTEADRQVYWMRWLEGLGISEDVVLHHRARILARRDMKGLSINTRTALRQARAMEADRGPHATVPLYSTDLPTNDLSSEEVSDFVLLVTVADEVWSELQTSDRRRIHGLGMTWMEAIEYEHDKETDPDRTVYRAIKKQVAFFRRKLVDRLSS